MDNFKNIQNYVLSLAQFGHCISYLGHSFCKDFVFFGTLKGHQVLQCQTTDYESIINDY